MAVWKEKQVFHLKKGEAKKVFFNAAFLSSGHIHYNIQSKDGTNACKIWWTLGPFGKNKDMGIHHNTGKLPIKGILWQKLKMKALQADTTITIHIDVEYVPLQIGYSRRF